MRRFLGGILVIAAVAGCFPFGGSERRIVGPYHLEQWEDGHTYYLHGPGEESTSGGGGLLEGTVTRVGWTNEVIIARRHANFRAEPDGWMVIDVRTLQVTGPLTDSTVASRPVLAAIHTMSPDSAWKKL